MVVLFVDATGAAGPSQVKLLKMPAARSVFPAGCCFCFAKKRDGRWYTGLLVDTTAAAKPRPRPAVATTCEVCGEMKSILVSIEALPRLLVAASA